MSFRAHRQPDNGSWGFVRNICFHSSLFVFESTPCYLGNSVFRFETGKKIEASPLFWSFAGGEIIDYLKINETNKYQYLNFFILLRIAQCGSSIVWMLSQYKHQLEPDGVDTFCLGSVIALENSQFFSFGPNAEDTQACDRASFLNQTRK